jgi:hypothetical protein
MKRLVVILKAIDETPKWDIHLIGMDIAVKQAWQMLIS